MHNFIIRSILAALTACSCLLSNVASAQDYPSKPIRWIVPYPAGGGTDFVTRTLVERLSAQMGQVILVDNKGGAAGAIGMQAAAQATPDGYTVVTGENGSLAINPSIYKKLAYSPTKDYRTVSLFAKNPFLLVVNPHVVPVTNFQEFVKYVQANPGKVSYASFGSGSIAHVMMELLKERTGLDLTHISYKGASPALQDLLGGYVGVMFVDYGSAMANMSTGRLLPLAVSTKERHPLLPDLPSLQELGVRDYDEFSWLGVMVPAKTPDAIVTRLRDETHKALKAPELLRAYAERGVIPMPSDEVEFTRLLRDDIAKWAEIVRKANIQAD